MKNRRAFPVVVTFVLVLLAPVVGVQFFALGADHPQPRTSLGNESEVDRHAHLRQKPKVRGRAALNNSAPETGVVVGNRITLTDGYSFEVDEVWKDKDEIWYRQGKISRGIPQVSVKSIKPIFKAPDPATATTGKITTVATPLPAAPEKRPVNWIHLADGARFRVDEVQETPAGYWYSRSNLSVFLERERVARIEIDRGDTATPAGRGSDWTSGNPMIDEHIRANGNRFGVDPYLVFLVIEQESHFRTRAVSPKGARGLMQLMPATARRFGVKNSFDVAENIKGGTQYLRELMDMFGGQVNLVLASYNAGEGAVLKYGRNVPPYRETRDYVKKIGKRYGLAAREGTDSESPAPRR
ncbi:MAG TPA: lytic transglycosylase domain-containing protein [Pyrinomonadaceae bacterium]|nr:lytic transglycosylase domain-containing protein [Pyrinomonadaceae bacterium]